jgi:O-methyltransferase
MRAIIDAASALAAFILNSRPVIRAIEILDNRACNCMCERGMLRQAFEFKSINKVVGDYFEFGLWKGKTFSYAHHMKHRFRQNDLVLWGFDSFQGLPDIDDTKDNVWHTGGFSCSEADFRRAMRRSGLKESEYRLVAGFYADSLNDALHERLAGTKAAIVYVDCDLYVSTKVVLEFLRRYLINGTIVCFDDFYNYKGAIDQGEQLALSEFATNHPEIRFIPYFDYCPLGKSFIVRLD